MKKGKIFIISLFLVVCIFFTFALPQKTEALPDIVIDYLLPFQEVNYNHLVSFEFDFPFWGIFYFAFSVQTEIYFSNNSYFNISKIVPIGVFTTGFGIKIPLGGLLMFFDFQTLYKTDLSNSLLEYPTFATGIELNITRYLRFRYYIRKITKYFNFFAFPYYMGIGFILDL